MRILDAYFDYAGGLTECDIVRLNQVPSPPPDLGWTCTEFYTLHLELKQSCDELLRQTNSGTRYEILRARERDGLETKVADVPTADVVDRFVEFHNLFTQHQKLSADNREYLIQLAELGNLTLSWISSASNGDLAFHAYVVSSRRARLLFSVIRRSEGNCGGALLGRANRLLHWQDICHFKDCGLSCYDFGGLYMKDDNPQLLGVDNFKLGFGGKVVKEYKCTKAMTVRGRVAIGFRHGIDNLGSLARRLRGLTRALTTKGTLETAEHYWFRVLDLIYERRLGIRTEEFIRLETGINNPDFFRYKPASYTEFRKLMKHVSIQPGKDVFMDYGSGLGRVLILAAMYPFKKVIGLELVERFNRAAARNFEKCRNKLKCTELQLLTAEATSCLPPNEVTIFYFYNPFRYPVLKRVLNNINDTLIENPRRVRLIFRHPINLPQILGELPWLYRRASYKIGENEYWIFENSS